MDIQVTQSNPYSNTWYAYDADTYDADCDESGFFSTSPVGEGSTKQEAIDDLLSQLEG